jgi:hypothetical protein
MLLSVRPCKAPNSTRLTIVEPVRETPSPNILAAMAQRKTKTNETSSALTCLSSMSPSWRLEVPESSPPAALILSTGYSHGCEPASLTSRAADVAILRSELLRSLREMSVMVGPGSDREVMRARLQFNVQRTGKRRNAQEGSSYIHYYFVFAASYPDNL